MVCFLDAKFGAAMTAKKSLVCVNVAVVVAGRQVVAATRADVAG